MRNFHHNTFSTGKLNPFKGISRVFFINLKKTKIGDEFGNHYFVQQPLYTE